MEYNYLRFQVEGYNRISSGNNSKRPASISNIQTYFDKVESPSKLQVGPTKDKPGPIFPIAEATAVKFVTISNPSRLISKTEDIKIPM